MAHTVLFFPEVPPIFIKRLFYLFFVALAQIVPVGWGYKEPGGAQLQKPAS